MTWKALVVGPGLLLCLLVAPPMAAGTATAVSRQAVVTLGGQWTWASGLNRVAEAEPLGIYGTRGAAAPENVPGARREASSWTDLSGDLWLFGGEGYSAGGFGSLNDLWKWDGTSWTWVSGSDVDDQPGTYGTKGVAAPGNVPGAREASVSWTDAAGDLWLFGGHGRTTWGWGYFNDIWKWNGTNWTWISGYDVANTFGTYGTKGVSSPLNVPGSRSSAVSWVDASGDLWVFGGYGYAASGSGYLNDLWKWNGASWTWVSGSSLPNQGGSYGTKGVAAPGNVPGARRDSVSWKDASGHLWLFGGTRAAAIGEEFLNDLWRWDGITWTWIGGSDTANQPGSFGTKGVAAPGNVPGARGGSISWGDASGRLWLLGGFGYAATERGHLNDLWRWDGMTWTWVGGSDGVSQVGIYGTKGVAAPGNVPGARFGSVPWTDAGGNFWLFGGAGFDSALNGFLHDLWKWNGSSWTWVNGPKTTVAYGVYGAMGVAGSENVPGARYRSVSGTGANASLWLFGGFGCDATGQGYLNDLWRWDGTSWTWKSGSSGANQTGSYGTKGVAAPGNVPGARGDAVSWSSANGSFWLFGGAGYGATPSDSIKHLNDLWKWDGTAWTWVSGSDDGHQPGTYGTKGVAAPENVPGARGSSVSWTDAGGNLWLFGGGGQAKDAVGGYGSLNDLWKWDGTNWTWMSGSDWVEQVGTYGTKGVAAPENVPGARVGSVSWIDSSGSLWLFGGYGQAAGGHGYLNDLWRWAGASWTWVSGSSGVNQPGSYGTKGVGASGNVPGARADAVSWTDASGNFWLFGGLDGVARSEGVMLNDLWRWDGTHWTWVSGSSETGQTGSYGTRGVPATGNVPGARRNSVSWADGNGNLWLFGGEAANITGTLNDLWVFGTTCSSVTPPIAGNGGPYGIGETIRLAASTVAGATYIWAGPNGFTSTLQNPTIANATVEMAGTYSVNVIVGGCSSAATGTNVVVLPGQILTVSRLGPGVGSVVSSPSGIDCGIDCSAPFPGASQVTLTATPDASSRFAGWMSDDCAGTEPCTLIVDGRESVSAWFLPSEGVGFYTVTPCRIVDTRSATGPYGGPALSAGASRAFEIAGRCGVPVDVSAVTLNVTVANPSAAGSLTLYPGTGVAPGTSTVSFGAWRTRANNATIGVVDGSLTVFDRQETGTTDIIIDVSGYYR